MHPIYCISFQRCTLSYKENSFSILLSFCFLFFFIKGISFKNFYQKVCYPSSFKFNPRNILTLYSFIKLFNISSSELLLLWTGLSTRLFIFKLTSFSWAGSEKRRWLKWVKDERRQKWRTGRPPFSMLNE